MNVQKCPEFNMVLFKKALFKIQRKSNFTLDDFDKIVEFIRYKSTNYVFLPTNTPKNLELSFNDWHEKIPKRFCSLSNEDYHDMFVKDLIDFAYEELCYGVIEKYMHHNDYNDYEKK